MVKLKQSSTRNREHHVDCWWDIRGSRGNAHNSLILSLDSAYVGYLKQYFEEVLVIFQVTLAKLKRKSINLEVSEWQEEGKAEGVVFIDSVCILFRKRVFGVAFYTLPSCVVIVGVLW